MKKLSLLPIIALFYFTSAQVKGTVTYVNEDGQPASPRKAAFLIEKVKLNDTMWTTNVYNVGGPLILTEQTKDETGSVKNGSYLTYLNGWCDTIGRYRDNQRRGKWSVLTTGLRHRQVWLLTYLDGAIVSKEDSNAVNTEHAKFVDSLAHLSPADKQDTVNSSFQGGDLGWQQYLLHNFHYPDDAVNNDIQGTVIVRFTIMKDGSIEDVFLDRSIAYPLDKEAMRVIQQSNGHWIAAAVGGEKKKSFKKQPIQFKLVTK